MKAIPINNQTDPIAAIDLVTGESCYIAITEPFNCVQPEAIEDCQYSCIVTTKPFGRSYLVQSYDLDFIEDES